MTDQEYYEFIDLYDCRVFRFNGSNILTDVSIQCDDDGYVIDAELKAYLCTPEGLKPVGFLDQGGLVDVKIVPDPDGGFVFKTVKIAGFAELELVPNFLM